MLSVPVQVIGKALSHKWPEFVDADVKPYSLTHSLDILYKIWLKKALGEMQTLRMRWL